MADTKATTPKAKAASAGPPARSGEDFRKEWADANNKEPSEMREIHAEGGWVDRFDGNGWVREEG